ncbi:MAG TPA: hypothetical protein DCY07_08530 [Rhodospirillaceae bacterium]|nr:hypothetical protein [Rhodospirillaceae bacterium]
MGSMLQRYGVRLAVLAVVVLVLLLAAALPWKSLIEFRLKTFLEAQGLHNVELTLSNIGVNSVSLKEIKIGNEQPLVLKDITLNYSLMELYEGDLAELVASGVDVNVNQEDKGWTVRGLENLQTAAPKTSPFQFPVAQDELTVIPFDKAQLENSSIHFAAKQWQMMLPIQVTWLKIPNPELTGKTPGFVLKAGDIDVIVADATAALSLNAEEKRWNGTWNAKTVTITGVGTDVPDLSGGGKLTVQADRAQVQGQFASADRSHHFTFDYNYYPSTPEKAEVKIIDASMPWMGGTIGTQQVSLRIGERQPLNINLKLQHVSIQSLLQKVTGEKTTATGTISGTLPVTIEKDGSLIFHQGNLQADEPGIITLPPDSIPGDNEQVALVREVLKNLHYTLLSVAVNNEGDHKLSIRMTLEGKNPDVHAGRPVKINVNLTGDMLDFVQQNILFLSDPRKLLERGEYENK